MTWCGPRTLDGAEIDKIIWDVEAGKALAIEHRRRKDWRKRELTPSALKQKLTTQMPHRCHILHQIGCGNQ